QQSGRGRRIGVLTGGAADDPQSQLAIGAFLQGLQELGWALGRNIQIDYRWGGADRDLIRRYANELLDLKPDVLLAAGSGAVGPLQQATRTVPIVFVGTVDPVSGGFVASLARPGGNITGFAGPEYGLSTKWLELLKQMVPDVRRVAVLRDP